MQAANCGVNLKGDLELWIGKRSARPLIHFQRARSARLESAKAPFRNAEESLQYRILTPMGKGLWLRTGGSPKQSRPGFFTAA